MTSLWTSIGITCLVVGLLAIKKPSQYGFPSRFNAALLAGLAPVFWGFGFDINRGTGSYPVGIVAGLLWVLIVATAWIARHHPAGLDDNFPKPTHPRAWRWFAAGLLVLLAFGTVAMITELNKQTAYDWLSLPIEMVALAGVYSYAFQRRLLPIHIWRVIAISYCIWAVVNLAIHWPDMMAGFGKAGGTGTFVTALILGLPIIIGIPALTCLALLRLSWFPPNHNKRAISN